MQRPSAAALAVACFVSGVDDTNTLPMDCDDSDSSSGDDDDEDLLLLLSFQAEQVEVLAGLLPREYMLSSHYYVKPRHASFYHTIVERYYERVDWMMHYRMDKETFHEILDSIAPLIERQDTNYRKAVTPGQRLSCTLLYLATGITMQQVASMEGISLTVVHRAVHECCRAIVEVLGKRCIVFPQTEDEMRVAAAQFERRAGIPQVIAALDGTHVPIRRPPCSGDGYLNRKKFASINTSAACNAKGEFVDVFTGWSGRAHDSTVLQDSPLWEEIRDGELGYVMKDAATDIEGQQVPMQLIADSAYSCVPHLLPAFKTTVAARDAAKLRFNQRHASTRGVIEMSFGRLKARWRKLLKGLDVSLDNAPDIIVACFVLHNICERKGLEPPGGADLDRMRQEYELDFPPMDDDDAGLQGGSAEGKAIRDAIVAHLV